MSFLDTKSPLILLYRDIPSLPDIPRYDLVLSPQFYVIKNEELPVKYRFQAKKLAPSILDELSGDDNLTYEVFKDGENWIYVGYDLQKLADFLDTKGGSIDRVGQIYFAEQLKDKITGPIEINDRDALTIVNDTVTLVPRSFFPDTEQFADFDDSFRPDGSFKVQRNYSSFISTKQAIVLASLFGILGIGYFTEGYRYHRAIKSAEAGIENLLNENPSLRGEYARESIYKKYTVINKEQRAIRDKIKSISRMTSKQVKIDSMSVDTKGYKLTLNVPNDPKTVKSLRTIAKRIDLGNFSIKNNKLVSEGKLQ